MFTDAEGLSAINAFDGGPAGLGYLGDVTAALALPAARSAAGSGAGGRRRLRRAAGAAQRRGRQVDAVELNPQMTALVREDFAAYSGHVYEHERVSWTAGEARGFRRAAYGATTWCRWRCSTRRPVPAPACRRWRELPVYRRGDAAVPGASRARRAAGHHALAEGPAPRQPEAGRHRHRGFARGRCRRSRPAAGRTIRNWNTVTLLVKNGDFASAEIAAVREFARQRSFDTVWYPVDAGHRGQPLQPPRPALAV